MMHDMAKRTELRGDTDSLEEDSLFLCQTVPSLPQSSFSGQLPVHSSGLTVGAHPLLGAGNVRK